VAGVFSWAINAAAISDLAACSPHHAIIPQSNAAISNGLKLEILGRRGQTP
jgi:hypothetical protein